MFFSAVWWLRMFSLVFSSCFSKELTLKIHFELFQVENMKLWQDICLSNFALAVSKLSFV